MSSIEFGGGRGTLRDWFDLRVQVNNFVTFKLTVFGHGVTIRKQIHDPVPEEV